MGAWAAPARALERLLATAVSWPLLSRVTGRLADLRLPAAFLAPLIRAYARAYGVDLSEAALPPEAYRHLQRVLHAPPARGRCARSTAGDGVVVSPSDSRLSAIGPVPPDGRLEQVKGATLRDRGPARAPRRTPRPSAAARTRRST